MLAACSYITAFYTLCVVTVHIYIDLERYRYTRLKDTLRMHAPYKYTMTSQKQLHEHIIIIQEKISMHTKYFSGYIYMLKLVNNAVFSIQVAYVQLGLVFVVYDCTKLLTACSNKVQCIAITLVLDGVASFPPGVMLPHSAVNKLVEILALYFKHVFCCDGEVTLLTSPRTKSNPHCTSYPSTNNCTANDANCST